MLDAYEKFNNEVKKNYERNKRCFTGYNWQGIVHKKGDDEDTPKLFRKNKKANLSWINNESLKVTS